MKSKLTLKHALYHTARMWAGLAKTGNASKPKTGVRNDCYLCEYFTPNNGGCKQCAEVMQKVWPRGCEHQKTSVYIEWIKEESNTQDAGLRKKYARQIADEAWNQWRKLKEITEK